MVTPNREKSKEKEDVYQVYSCYSKTDIAVIISKTYKQILKSLCQVFQLLVGTKSLTDTDLICTNYIIYVRKYMKQGGNHSSPSEPLLRAAFSPEDENALMESKNYILTLLKQTPVKQGIITKIKKCS